MAGRPAIPTSLPHSTVHFKQPKKGATSEAVVCSAETDEAADQAMARVRSVVQVLPFHSPSHRIMLQLQLEEEASAAESSTVARGDEPSQYPIWDSTTQNRLPWLTSQQ